MVKHLNIAIDEKLYDNLTKKKGKRTWQEFFEDLVK
jgi:predicted CopG family antitoxin